MVTDIIAGAETFLSIAKDNGERAFTLDRTDSL